jgi:ABC-2 type transport system permease protein
MSTTSAPSRSHAGAPAPAQRGKLNFGGLLVSEWIKLTTVRSTVWSLAILVLISVGLGLLIATFLEAGDAGAAAGSDAPGGPAAAAAAATDWALTSATAGMAMASLVAAILGALNITSEYSTGMIRSSLAAVPKRLPVLFAKAVVLALVTFGVGLITLFGTYLIVTPILEGKGFEAHLDDPQTVIALIGGAAYLAIVAVFSLGLGTIIRSGAGAIAAAVGVLLILPPLFMLVPLKWLQDLAPYLLSSAGGQMHTIPNGSTDVEGWVAVIVSVAWAVVSLAIAAVMLKRRDA